MKHPFERKNIRGERLVEFLRAIGEEGVKTEDLYFLCIGTDRSSGDAFGPLVGSWLREAGYRNVTGTLDWPCDADTMEEHLQEIPAGKIVLALDACLGREASSVGLFQVAAEPIEPGKSMGHTLPKVGHFSIAAIVNRNEGQPYRVLQTTSLYLVMTMARELVQAVQTAFPLEAAPGITPTSPLPGAMRR
ncbi:spore protease YyaC [Paenibacillus sp. 32O-W]|uniref:spore protease YyaC n=1 Tax=Paenibacillus sp. 32O-W TaxID=1695218 RepID=UPI0011AA3231|nr:spore protease YyaC [Paenibacillus sp. 32O-W]